MLATGAVTFELYRFLNRHLSVTQIGIWSVVLASATTGRLIDLGLGGGVVKFVAKYMGADAKGQAGTTIQMALLGMAILFGVASVALFPILHAGLSLLIKDPASLTQARSLLPYALVTLVLGALSGVTLSALDGCQRMDLRAFLGIGGSLVQLVSAYCLVPAFGISGLAIGQVIQSVAVFGLGVSLLVKLVGPGLYTFDGWRKESFVELIKYGSGFQAAAFGQILFEPAVKAILTRYSGLEFTGYYEMANRMILQIRSILVSGYQSLVPYVASAFKSDDELRGIYISSYRLLFLFSAACFGMVGLLLPYILQLWLGRFVPTFVEIGELSLVGWALNTLNSPAYYIFLGIGKLRWPVIAHTAIGVCSAGFGALFGSIYGGFGALGAVAVVLIAGSHIVSYAFHSQHKIPLHWIVPRESRVLSVFALVGPIIVMWSAIAHDSALQSQTLILMLLFGLVVLVLALGNPSSMVVLRLFGEFRKQRRSPSAGQA